MTLRMTRQQPPTKFRTASSRILLVRRLVFALFFQGEDDADEDSQDDDQGEEEVSDAEEEEEEDASPKTKKVKKTINDWELINDAKALWTRYANLPRSASRATHGSNIPRFLACECAAAILPTSLTMNTNPSISR